MLIKKFISFIRELVAPDYEILVFQVEELHGLLGESLKERDELNNTIAGLKRDVEIEKSIALGLSEELDDRMSELDSFCELHFIKKNNIAYSQKRKTVLGNDVDILLNELVTPDSFLVQKLFLHSSVVDDIKLRAKSIGDKVARSILWTDDKNLSTSGDYYLYPNETIADKKGDCEDHAFIVMSAFDELGGCWGFYKGGGHAFNCFVYDNDLYVLDTVGNRAVIKKYADQSDYDIRFIISRDNTYQVGKPINFGKLAGWD